MFVKDVHCPDGVRLDAGFGTSLTPAGVTFPPITGLQKLAEVAFMYQYMSMYLITLHILISEYYYILLS